MPALREPNRPKHAPRARESDAAASGRTGGVVMGDARVKVAHAVPGRIRLRIPRIKNDCDYAANVRVRLGALPGITSVEANPVTGSVVVTYDDAETSLPDLVPDLSEEFHRHLFPDVDRSQIESMLCASPNGSTTAPPLARRIYSVLGTVDHGLGLATGGSLDLRVLLPVSLFVLGIGRLLSHSNVPTPTWFDLLWFSFGTFVALNAPSAPVAQPP